MKRSLIAHLLFLVLARLETQHFDRLKILGRQNCNVSRIGSTKAPQKLSRNDQPLKAPKSTARSKEKSSASVSQIDKQTDWDESINIPEYYAQYLSVFRDMLLLSKSSLNGHIALILNTRNGVHLISPAVRLIRLVPYRVGPKAGEIERSESKSVLTINVMAIPQTDWALPVFFVSRKVATARYRVYYK